jgi:hypothetical protein
MPGILAADDAEQVLGQVRVTLRAIGDAWCS